MQLYRKEKISYIVLLVLLFLLPFNALPIHFLGQGGYEGALYPSIFLFLFTILVLLMQAATKVNIYVFNKGLFYIITSFTVVIFVSFLFNIEDILAARHMEKEGLNRFIGQYIQLLLGFSLSYIIAYILRTKKQFMKTIRFIYIMMMIFIIFSIFQFFAYEVQGVFLKIYQFIGQFIYHDSIIPFALERRHALHSFTQEPSFLSMYIGVMGPFVIGYSLYIKKYAVSILMVLVLFMSLSRTGYVIILFQLLLFGYLSYFKFFKIQKILLFSIGGVIALSILIFLTPVGNVVLSLFDIETNGSNAARYAGAYSALMVWINNNWLLGVGLGQAGFSSIEYLPEWGYLSNDVWDTVNEKRWPPIHNLLIRILVETGMIGLLLWLSIFFYTLVKIHKVIYKQYTLYRHTDYMGYSVFISIIGTMLTMMTRELFTNMLIWVSLGMALSYLNIYRGVLVDKKKSC